MAKEESTKGSDTLEIRPDLTNVQEIKNIKGGKRHTNYHSSYFTGSDQNGMIYMSIGNRQREIVHKTTKQLTSDWIVTNLIAMVGGRPTFLDSKKQKKINNKAPYMVTVWTPKR